MISLKMIKRTEPKILENMKIHYSQPKGFVGRNICYSIEYNDIRYGSIVWGSSTLHLVGRDEFFGITKKNKNKFLKKIANNIFYHIEPINGEYPVRNFTIKVLKEAEKIIVKDWKNKYGDELIGLESLVELPRTGEIYKRSDWIEVGLTKGYTCKRTAGKGTDSWSGKRIWNTDELRPKRVFVKHLNKEIVNGNQ